MAPIFGYSIPGYNSIYNADPVEIRSYYPGTIYARNCYFSGGNPIYTGTVDYIPYLTYNPNPSIRKQPVRIESPVAYQAIIDNKENISGLKEIDQARLLMEEKKYTEALSIFEEIINKYPNYLSGEISLNLLSGCLKELNRENDIYTKYSDIHLNKSKTRIAAMADLLERQKYIKEGKYTEIIQNTIKTLSDFANTDYEKYGLYDIATVYFYYTNEKKTGEAYYREFIKKYPNDPLSVFALSAIGEKYPENKEPKPLSLEKGNDELQIQNYPNPFNPATIINYSIPKDGYVTIKVYDAIGREVKALVSETKAAGSYTVAFNATNLSSGIYFYRLTMQPNDGTKVININKSMRLVK